MTPLRLLLLAFALSLPACAAPTLSGEQAHELVTKQGAMLLDVRTVGEFSERHLEGAVNIPVQELSGRLSELQNKNQDIVVYCRSGQRSANAAKQLREAGFTRVHDLGSISNWK